MNRRLTYLAVFSFSVFGIVMFSAHGIMSAAETPPVNLDPAASPAALLDFPEGTATPSDQCGACHQTIYKEYTEGFGSDLHWAGVKLLSLKDKTLAFPKGNLPSPTAHSVAGTDPWPLEAMQVEENGKQKCNVCHYPQAMEYPDMAATKIAPPKPRVAHQERGITCASCHLTPDGKIRGPYAVDAPHATIKDDRTTTSIACAYCHSAGERIIGKQTQTFLEWREDFSKPGLGTQQCQDCHMPKTMRKLAENFDVPERVSARHLWTGGHSYQRIASALTLAIVQTEVGMPQLAFHLTNIGAGHSVPTGSNRRAIYLMAEIVNGKGKVVATKEWMFAPRFGNRPDDKAFVEEDKKGPEPVAATQADAQGPHETSIRAGEQRVLDWAPTIAKGAYTVRARLIYDLNRYNDRAFKDDQTELTKTSFEIAVTKQRASVR
jgi:nitrate/TMAO reductase-like tetraheme cytochrome c subunit